MEQNFEIVSYAGAKPLLFGMAEAQVEAIVGPPERMTVNNRGEPDASYQSFSIRYSREDKTLVEVGFSKTARVTIRGINVFNDANAFQDILRLATCPYEYFGFIILLDLGITLTGFHDNDPNQLAITAFTRGRWDHSKSKFRKFAVV
jgi:hypothetical protein